MVLYKRHKNVLLVEENISLHCLDSWALTWHALVDTCSEGVFTLMCTVMLQHTKHQSIPRHTQSHSGQLSGWKQIYVHVLYNIIMLFWWPAQLNWVTQAENERTVFESLTDNVTGLERHWRQWISLKIIPLILNIGPFPFFCTITPSHSGRTVDNYFAVELGVPQQEHGLPTCMQHLPPKNPFNAKSHCRYLSLNICGWIIITHTSNFGVDSAGCRSRAAFTSCWKKWKSGITFTCLTWTVFMCLTCHSLANHV